MPKKIFNAAHKTLTQWVLNNKTIRYIFIGHIYRNIINPCETIHELRKDEDSLEEYYWEGKLRHYAHILDKGIQREDFQVGHSSYAYNNAVRALEHLKSEKYDYEPTVVWGKKKVHEFESLQNGKFQYYASPYASATCGYETLLDVIKTRRSIRRYLDRSVTIEDIKKVIEPINWSPTSCNRQTARAFATNNMDTVKKCMTLCAGSGGFSRNVPLFISFCADIRVYSMPTEAFIPSIDISLGIQNCNLIAHTLGISLTLLTWAQHTEEKERQLRMILGIPEYCQIIVNAVGGHPSADAETPARKTLESTLTIRE